MKAYQFSKLDMYLRVRSFFSSNPQQWEAYQAVVAVLLVFGRLLDELQQLAALQLTVGKGFTYNRDKQRTIAHELALQLVGALQALASETKNSVLKDKVHFIHSKLQSSRVIEFLNLCHGLSDQALENQQALVPYYLKQAKLDNFILACQELERMIIESSGTRAKAKEMTLRIANLNQELDALLHDHLDMLMLTLHQEQPELYEKYRLLRKLDSHKGKKAKPVEETAKA